MTPQGSGSEADSLADKIRHWQHRLRDRQNQNDDLSVFAADELGRADFTIQTLETELGSLRTRLEGMRGDAELVGRFTEPGAVIQLGTHDWVNFSEAIERLASAVLALLGKGE